MRNPVVIQHRLIAWLAALMLLFAASGCALFGGGGGGGWTPKYEVETGDTLYSIAWGHGLDYRELAAWNDIKPPYQIKSGDMLRLTAPEGFVYYPPDNRPAGKPAPKPVQQAEKPQSKPPAPATATPVQTPVFEPDDDEEAPAEIARAEPPAPTQPAPAAENLKWRWPAQGEILRSYAPDDGNSGLDIGGAPGQPIRAASGGKVVYGGSGLQGYGLLVIVKHDDNYLSAYGYNRKLLVQQGDEVHIGQPIAEMGEGPEHRPSLHFEVRRAGKTVDPLQILPAKP